MIAKKTKLRALSRLRGAIGRSPSKAKTRTTLRTLTQGLRDRSVEVADYTAAAIEDLGGAGRPLIPALMKTLRRRPRFAVGEALAGIGVAARPVLGRLMANRDRRVRRIVSWTLGCPKIVS